MKLSTTINYINAALNYPALSYIDIALFMDMAIAEMNTSLHTSIPLVKDMVEEFRQNMSKYEPNKIILTEDPDSYNYIIPTDPDTTEGIKFYYSTSTKKYYIYNNHKHEFEAYSVLKGMHSSKEGLRMFQAVAYGGSAAWVEISTAETYEAEFSHYLPDEWIMLWLIPYVCYKYTVRDGGTAQSFAEELTQGFQQLQDTYDIPYTVNLKDYADKEAYTKVVEEKLPNLDITVPLRAIYPEMKHSRNVQAVFESFYDRGGF